MTPVRALQLTLDGEHAAVYVYGALGSQVSDSAQPALAKKIASSYDDHVHRRDHLVQRIAAHGATPAPSAASYRAPGPAVTTAQQRTVATIVERRCLALYGQLVEHSSGSDRRWSVATLDSCARRLLEYGAAPSDFPGMTV